MPSNCKYRDYNITIGDLPFLETVDGFFAFFSDMTMTIVILL